MVYIIQAEEPMNLQSKGSTLNGQLLEWISHEVGPNLRGEVTSLPIFLPGLCQFFIAFES